MKGLLKNPYIVGGIIAVGALWYLKKKAGDVADAVNPLNNDNVFYTGYNSVGQVVYDDPHWSLGGYIYDLFTPEYDPNKD